jgi:hypothetical protein
MTTTSTSTIFSRVRNYEGTTPFLLNLKASLKKWGNLTPKQLESAEKALKGIQSVKIETMSEDLQKIAKYDGTNVFMADIKNKLMTYGTLTDSQVRAALNQIQKESDKKQTLQLKIPTPGETLKIGRTIGQDLKEKYGLKFNPILIDITKVLGVSPKAVKFEGKMTIKRGDICRCCAKTLTDEFSMLTGVGKLCSKHMGIPYITDRSQTERFREEYLKKVDEIGEMEFWIPKSKIIKWEGKTEIILKMI